MHMTDSAFAVEMRIPLPLQIYGQASLPQRSILNFCSLSRPVIGDAVVTDVSSPTADPPAQSCLPLSLSSLLPLLHPPPLPPLRQSAWSPVHKREALAPRDPSLPLKRSKQQSITQYETTGSARSAAAQDVQFDLFLHERLAFCLADPPQLHRWLESHRQSCGEVMDASNSLSAFNDESTE